MDQRTMYTLRRPFDPNHRHVDIQNLLKTHSWGRRSGRGASPDPHSTVLRHEASQPFSALPVWTRNRAQARQTAKVIIGPYVVVLYLYLTCLCIVPRSGLTTFVAHLLLVLAEGCCHRSSPPCRVSTNLEMVFSRCVSSMRRARKDRRHVVLQLIDIDEYALTGYSSSCSTRMSNIRVLDASHDPLGYSLP